jgi:hypothetical protein
VKTEISLRPQLFKYKGERCAYCGKTVKEIEEEFGVIRGYFDFHHVDPSTKADIYANMIRRQRLSSEILDEVDKCILVCEGCHTILHGQNQSVEVCAVVIIRHGNRVRHFRQWLPGQVITSKKRGNTFLSNEMPSIFPCWVAYKEKGKPHEERRLTTLRVIQKRLFNSVVKRLQIGDAFGIWSHSGKLVADLSRNADGFYLQQLIAFPLITGEFDDENGRIEMFIRRGAALYRNGEVSPKGLIQVWFQGISDQP